jgi:hypothetical protein
MGAILKGERRIGQMAKILSRNAMPFHDIHDIFHCFPAFEIPS